MSFVIFILGLCCGSFVNMLLYRVAMNYGLIKKKKLGDWSVCDFCGKQLNWFDNIPVISWLVLKGKSRCCGKKLPISYPLVELLVGILFLFNHNIFGYFIIVFLVFSAFFDLKWMILPDFSTVILILLSLFFVKDISFVYAAIGAAGFLYLLYLITKGKGMGFGDVKLAVFMGLFLGWPKIIVAFYVAFIVGAIVGLISIILKKKKLKSEIPFGPFLIFGTLVAWWWGKFVINCLYRWL